MHRMYSLPVRKPIRPVTIVLFCLLFTSALTRAQDSAARHVCVGVILGDPLGITMKYQFEGPTAFQAAFGPDYFGSPRLQLDYVWEFNIFHSAVTNEYAGPGLAVAFAKGVRMFFSREPHVESFANQEDNGFELGGRAIFGINLIPLSSPMQYFVEAGPLIAFKRIFDLDLDGAIGVRYTL